MRFARLQGRNLIQLLELVGLSSGSEKNIMFDIKDKVTVLGQGRAHIIEKIVPDAYVVIFACDAASAFEAQKKPLLQACSILEKAHPNRNVCKECSTFMSSKKEE